MFIPYLAESDDIDEKVGTLQKLIEQKQVGNSKKSKANCDSHDPPPSLFGHSALLSSLIDFKHKQQAIEENYLFVMLLLLLPYLLTYKLSGDDTLRILPNKSSIFRCFEMN